MAKLSVVIPWADRPELARTLAHNAEQFRRLEAEVLVACCGGDAAVLKECIAGAECDVGAVFIDASFNKALALNIGAHFARGDVLFFLDSDLLLGEGACLAALERLSGDSAVTLARVTESVPPAGLRLPHLKAITHVLELESSDGRRVRVETNCRSMADGSRSAPGNVVLLKRHFERAGGMNSDLTGWGFEDLDLLIRLQLCEGLRVESAGSAVHLTHGDDRRRIDGASRVENETHNFNQCMANYGLGHYSGTYADDVASWRDAARVVARFTSA